MYTTHTIQLALRASRSLKEHIGRGLTPPGTVNSYRLGGSRKGSSEVVTYAQCWAPFGLNAPTAVAWIPFGEAALAQAKADASQTRANAALERATAPVAKAPAKATAAAIRATIVEAQKRLEALEAEEAAQAAAAKKAPAKKAAKPPTAKQVERALAVLARVG